MTFDLRIGILSVVSLAFGCYGHEAFETAARARAAVEFHCPPEGVNIRPAPELGYEVMEVTACGQRAHYACVHQPGGHMITCIHEAEAQKS
jgi:hypothetical protein